MLVGVYQSQIGIIRQTSQNQSRIDRQGASFRHDQLNGERLSDLPLLAELQHFRAATCLIDFTRNALVALWFACEKKSTTESEDEVEETDGKVYAVRIDDPARLEQSPPNR